MTEGYGATAARRIPDQQVGKSNLSVVTCMAVQHHGVVRGKVVRSFLCQCHVLFQRMLDPNKLRRMTNGNMKRRIDHKRKWRRGVDQHG